MDRTEREPTKTRSRPSPTATRPEDYLRCPCGDNATEEKRTMDGPRSVVVYKCGYGCKMTLDYLPARDYR